MDRALALQLLHLDFEQEILLLEDMLRRTRGPGSKNDENIISRDVKLEFYLEYAILIYKKALENIDSLYNNIKQ